MNIRTAPVRKRREMNDDAVDQPVDVPTDDDSAVDPAESSIYADNAGRNHSSVTWARRRRRAIVATLLALLVGMAVAAVAVTWHKSALRADVNARDESVQAAKDATVAMLSYQPASAAEQLDAARDLLTGAFRDSYTELTDTVVIPGAQQKQIAAVASVPAAASVSADADHAVVLVFVDQATTVGTTAPTQMASSIKVTLDKIDGRWKVSEFEPI